MPTIVGRRAESLPGALGRTALSTGERGASASAQEPPLPPDGVAEPGEKASGGGRGGDADERDAREEDPDR